MSIRNDFQSVEELLNRLLQLSVAFETNNRQVWPHLKNNEDFKEVYKLAWELKAPLENIYAEGRDLSVFMSSKLKEFNYAEIYPTLKGYVESFDNGWIDRIEFLISNSQAAKDTCEKLEYVPWAISQMICLYDKQIELVNAAKHAIESLKVSDLYKWEDGQSQQTYPVPEYNKILECVHSIGKMFERLPSTYAGKDEESLRDHILVALQGVVSGSATGESFNKRGKTDILVRNGGDNEFIGECKFWRGKSVYLDTISQLLGYLSWRDNNTAVIVFVPNSDFASVLDKVSEYTAEHPEFIRATGMIDKTWQNFEFRMESGSSHVINVAVMLYHVPPSS